MLDEYLLYKKSEEDKINDWWKKRRFSYNLILGVLGVFLILFETVFLNKATFWWVKLIPDILGLIILANLCYYLGFLLEKHIYQDFRAYYFPSIGRVIFWFGTFFSITIMLWLEFIALKGI